MFKQWYSSLTEWVDRRIGWSKLPWPLGLLVILGLRFRLRAKNLYDSGRGALDVPPPGDEWHVDHLTARTIDGTYNDLEEPLMGGLGSRFGRNVPLDHAYPDPDDRLLEPDPRRVSLRAADPRRVHPRDDPQPPRRRLDPVRGARLVQPRPEPDGEPVADRAGRKRSVAAASDGGPADAQGPELGSRRAAHFRHRRHTLVGRLADLRQRARLREGDPLRRGRPDPRLDPRAAAGGGRGTRRPPRCRRQLLDRARPPARALHARAQRDLRAAARRVSGPRRPDAVREGAPRQRRADGQDPHGRLDAGDHRPPDDHPRAARELVRPAGRALRQDLRPPHELRDPPRHSRGRSGALRRPVLADRGVRRRLPDAPADPRRLTFRAVARRSRAAASARSRR